MGHQGRRALPPEEDSRLQYCSQKDKGQAALGAPSVFTFVSPEEPAV